MRHLEYRRQVKEERDRRDRLFEIALAVLLPKTHPSTAIERAWEIVNEAEIARRADQEHVYQCHAFARLLGFMRAYHLTRRT